MLFIEKTVGTLDVVSGFLNYRLVLFFKIFLRFQILKYAFFVLKKLSLKLKQIRLKSCKNNTSLNLIWPIIALI